MNLCAQHRNILLYLGAHFCAPDIFLVTELVEGPNGHHSLTQVLRDRTLRQAAG
eukprot:COSAG05_NODE_23722_length_256_cov_0.649682_1_plen_53_part_01